MPTVYTGNYKAPFQSGYLTGSNSQKIYNDEKRRESARFAAQQSLEMQRMKAQKEATELAALDAAENRATRERERAEDIKRDDARFKANMELKREEDKIDRVAKDQADEEKLFAQSVKEVEKQGVEFNTTGFDKAVQDRIDYKKTKKSKEQRDIETETEMEKKRIEIKNREVYDKVRRKPAYRKLSAQKKKELLSRYGAI